MINLSWYGPIFHHISWQSAFFCHVFRFSLSSYFSFFLVFVSWSEESGHDELISMHLIWSHSLETRLMPIIHLLLFFLTWRLFCLFIHTFLIVTMSMNSTFFPQQDAFIVFLPSLTIFHPLFRHFRRLIINKHNLIPPEKVPDRTNGAQFEPCVLEVWLI